MDTQNGLVGDFFMVYYKYYINYENKIFYKMFFQNFMEPMISRIPFMPTVGNHEKKYNYLHFTERFRLLPST